MFLDFFVAVAFETAHFDPVFFFVGPLELHTTTI